MAWPSCFLLSPLKSCYLYFTVFISAKSLPTTATDLTDLRVTGKDYGWYSPSHKWFASCTHTQTHMHVHTHTTHLCTLFSDVDLCRPLPTVLLQPPLAAGGVFVRLFKLLFEELRLPLVSSSGLEPTAVPAPCTAPGCREGHASAGLAACAQSPGCAPPLANRGRLLEPGSGRGGVCRWDICCCCCCCCCVTGELDFLLL